MEEGYDLSKEIRWDAYFEAACVDGETEDAFDRCKHNVKQLFSRVGSLGSVRLDLQRRIKIASILAVMVH